MATDADIEATAGIWLYHPVFPAYWKRRPLYALADWVNGLAFRNIQFSPTGKPVIKIAEIKDGISGQTNFTKQTFDESVHVTNGNLLFSWSGQPETSIDASWWREPDGWLNQHIFKVTPKPDVDPTFFFYLLRYLKPHFIGIARNKQTTGLGHVTKRDLKQIEAAYPEDHDEQRAIAHVLGTLDDKIELNRRMNETLEAMARALFKSWFVDFDPVRAKCRGEPVCSPHSGQVPHSIHAPQSGQVPQSGQARRPAPTEWPQHILDLFPDRFVNSEFGEIPEGWEMASLPDVIEVNPTRALRKGAVAPYLGMANIPTRGHSPDVVADRPFGSGMRFMNGDTLVARITPCLENGKTAYVDFLDDGQVGWGSTEYIVLRPRAPLPTEFAYCLARDSNFREFAIQSMTGSSGRQRVPAESLAHFQVVTAPKPIAEAFGQLIKPLFARASSATRESRTLTALRDTLLPKLISGELRVKDAERFIGRQYDTHTTSH